MECAIWKSGLPHDQIHTPVNVNCSYVQVTIYITGMSKAAYIDAVLSGVGEALCDNSNIIVQ